MKYSVIMPYYRRTELKFTLESYSEFYKNRDDLEIIIVEDSKNNIDDHNQLFSILDQYKGILDIKVVIDPKVSFNPSSKYNVGFKASTGSILMLTNPEVPHTLDILSAVDKEDLNNLYIICACKSVFIIKDNGSVNSNEYKTHMWYQHTAYRDVKYHFCTFISRENYDKIGGFDERFCAGIAYDDDNFVRRVQKANIFMVSRDDLITYHIEHSRSYGISPEEYHRLTQVNLKIWASQVATQNF